MTTYLKAKDVMAPRPVSEAPLRMVDASMPVVDLLPRLLDAPGRVVGVKENSELVGVVTESSLLEGFGRMVAPRDDSSLLSVECAPADFSASRLAHAVEDAGGHLVDMWSVPADDGMILVTLRVRLEDPSSVMHHLERYGFSVTEACGSRFADAEIAAERLMALNVLLNV